MQAATFYGPEEHYLQPWATEDETAKAAKAKPQGPSPGLLRTQAHIAKIEESKRDVAQWKKEQAANKGAQT